MLKPVEKVLPHRIYTKQKTIYTKHRPKLQGIYTPVIKKNPQSTDLKVLAVIKMYNMYYRYRRTYQL